MGSRPESASSEAASAGPGVVRFGLLALQAAIGLLLIGLVWGRFPEFYRDPVRDLAVLFALVATLALLGTSGAGRGVKHEAERGYLVIANTVWNLTLLAKRLVPGIY